MKLLDRVILPVSVRTREFDTEFVSNAKERTVASGTEGLDTPARRLPVRVLVAFDMSERYVHFDLAPDVIWMRF